MPRSGFIPSFRPSMPGLEHLPAFVAGLGAEHRPQDNSRAAGIRIRLGRFAAPEALEGVNFCLWGHWLSSQPV